MKKSFVLLSLLTSAATTTLADTTWISTSSSAWITATNWNNGLPSTGPQLQILADSATIQHAIDITGTTARNTIGISFSAFAGGAGFTFGSSTNNSPGFQSRAGGAANGVLNNDDSTQTFNVSFTMFSSGGVAGVAAAQTFNAAAGSLIFSGNHAGSGRSTVNNNGGTLTIDGAFNVTIGIAGATNGDIIGTGGLIKSGAGTLTLGGTLANGYSGQTKVNQGLVLAAKNSAFGTGSMLLNGGTLGTGGFNETAGTLDLDTASFLDFGSGASALAFADSDAQDWGGSILSVTNWTAGSDTFRIGTDGTGFDTQLALIRFTDLGNAPAQIDSSGFITPVVAPEPSSALLCGLGVLGLFGRRRRA